MQDIETERLILRDFRQTDLPAYQAMCAHADSQRFCSEDDGAPGVSERLLNLFIDWATEKPRTRFQLALTLPGDVLIGSCGIRITSTDDWQGSFGCELDPAHWGQGYACEAAWALFRFGFTRLGLHRIYGETNSENEPAIALAKKLGMRVEGELREHRWFQGRWWNTTILSLLESEFSKSPFQRTS